MNTRPTAQVNRNAGANTPAEKMNSAPLRVGIVGVNVGRSWSSYSHVPAIRSLADLKFAAVATRHEKSARAAAEAFGVEHWFADPLAMVRSDEVDLVCVSVNVPAHREIVLAALAAGKHVYCEWPLGRNTEEAEEMAAAAEGAGVHTAIGLQGRANPAARRAEALVAEGAIGQALTARVVATTSGFGPEFPSAYAYFDDSTSGANLTTIAGGHALDLTMFVLGALREVEAMTSIQFPTYHLTDTSQRHTRTVPDHLLVLGRYANGCTASIEVIGGEPEPWPFSFEIKGSAGRLALRGGDRHGFQGGDLRLERDGKPEPIDQPLSPGLTGPPLNLSELYTQFARDIREGTHFVPNFAHAVRMTRLLDAVSRAAGTGARQPARDSPR